MGPFLVLQFYSVDLPACLCIHNIQFIFILIALYYCMRSGKVIPKELLLLLKIVFTILGILLPWVNFKIALSNSMNNWVGILMGIALNLYITVGKKAIGRIIWILKIHEHWRSFHLLGFSSISFLTDLKFLSYRSFISLVRVTPSYFIFSVTIVKGVISLISLSSCLPFE